MATKFYQFGPHRILSDYVFYTTHLSFAMVNLRPAVPGHILLHVLIIPKREVKRFTDLTGDETCDLWLTAYRIGAQLLRFHNATSLSFTIQDGPQSGQTVPHVHVHILPRSEVVDIEKNDEIHDACKIDQKGKGPKPKKVDMDEERRERSHEEMSEEAEAYRLLFSL